MQYTIHSASRLQLHMLKQMVHDPLQIYDIIYSTKHGLFFSCPFILELTVAPLHPHGVIIFVLISLAWSVKDNKC